MKLYENIFYKIVRRHEKKKSSSTQLHLTYFDRDSNNLYSSEHQGEYHFS